MQNDYFYKAEHNLNLELGSEFDTSTSVGTARYLVSNDRQSNTEIYAPEVNLYFDNTLDPFDLKVSNLKKLYEIRALRFEYAQDVESSVRVGKTVAVISNKKQSAFVDTIKEQNFEAIEVETKVVWDLNGHLGKFDLETKTKEGLSHYLVDQVVWFNAPERKTKLIGVYDPDLIGVQESINQLQKPDSVFTYRNTIKADGAVCLQKNKREEVCGKCVDVCSEKAVFRNDKSLRIEIASIQCVGCGQCASVCPTGALDYGPAPRTSFDKISALYKGSIALVIPENVNIETLDVELPPKVLPLLVEDCGYLDEDYLLSLLHNTGHPILVFAEELSQHQVDIIAFVNDIYSAIFNLNAVYFCNTVDQINEILCDVQPFEIDLSQTIGEDLSKRQRVAARISRMVNGGDYGIIPPSTSIPFGAVTIDESQCTLCLSCVDACAVGALVPNPDDNSLRFTPALCVQCGQCENTCPEKNCLSLVSSGLELKSSYFQSIIMAQDEIFNCVECGKGFAPAKSVAKIVQLMTPKFGNDTLRIRTLSCCPDCKAKVMLEAMETVI